MKVAQVFMGRMLCLSVAHQQCQSTEENSNNGLNNPLASPYLHPEPASFLEENLPITAAIHVSRKKIR